MSEEDYYKILSVEPAASQAEVNEAARKLLAVWSKSGASISQSANGQYGMLTRISKASAVLTDPVQRLEYDIEHGLKKDFQGQTKAKKGKGPLPIKYSESIEALQTYKIRGELDYDLLQKTISAVDSSLDMEIPKTWLSKIYLAPLSPLEEPARYPESTASEETKFSDPWTEDESFAGRRHTYATESIDEVVSTPVGSEISLGGGRDSVGNQPESTPRTSGDADEKTQTRKVGDGREKSLDEHGLRRVEPPSMALDTIKPESRIPSDLSMPGSEGFKRPTPDPKAIQEDLQNESLVLVRTAESMEKLEIQYLDLLNKIKATLSRRRTETGPQLEFEHRARKYRTGSLPAQRVKGKNHSSRLQHAIQLLEGLEISEDDEGGRSSGIAVGNKSMPLEDTAIAHPTEEEILEEVESLIDNFRRSVVETHIKSQDSAGSAILTEDDDFSETARRAATSDYASSDETLEKSRSSSKSPGTSVMLGQENSSKRSITMDSRCSWNNPLLMSTEGAEDEVESHRKPLKNVSATTRIAGADIQTIYYFGPDTEAIEVLVNGEVMARITQEWDQDVYCNAMKHDDLPPGVDVCASTVIAANNCIVTTEVSRRGRRESIAVYKDDVLLCRTGNTILEQQ